MPHPRRALLRDSASIAFGQYVARAMVLVRGWAAALALGPSGFGAWNALNLVFDYGAYATLGALQGLDLKLPAAVAAGDRERAHRLMAGAWAIVLVGGVVFGAIVVPVALRKPASVAVLDGRLVLLMLVATVLQLGFQYLGSALRAYGRFVSVSVGQVLQALLGAGLGVALVWRFGLWGLLWGWIAGSALALWRMRRACPEAPLVPAHVRDGLDLTRLGLPIFAYYLASLVLRSVDRLALVRFADAHALGLYSLGLMAVGLVLFVPEAVAYVLFPRIAAAYHGGAEREPVRASVLRVQRALAVVMPLGVGLAIVAARPAVEWLLPAYRDGVPALQRLAVGALALSTATVPSYFLLGSGRQHSLLVVGVLAAVVNAGLVFTVARLRPEPAAVALAATAGYVLFALAILTRASFELLGDAGSRARFALTSLLPAAWGAGAAFAVIRLVPARGVGGLFAGTELFTVVYAPLMLVMARGLGIRTLLKETRAAR